MKKILVTGGAGFVGSSLISELVKDTGVLVYSLDNYFTGVEENHIKGAEYIRGDCRDIKKLINFRPDVVYHFGEYSRVSTSFEDIGEVLEFNFRGTYEVVEFCRKHATRLVYSASSTKFGDGGENRHGSPYAYSKFQNTELIKNYGKWFNLEYCICYFYNVYGEKQISTGKYATVIGIFEKQYQSGTPLTVVSPGHQKRDFTHIGDVVRGLAILKDSGAGDGYCFGTGKKYTMLEVARLFKNDITMLPSRAGERFECSIDLSKSHEIGWSPRSSNLEKYIEHFKKGEIK